MHVDSNRRTTVADQKADQVKARKEAKQKHIVDNIFLILTEIFKKTKDGYAEIPITDICKKHKLDSRVITVVVGGDGSMEYVKKVGRLYHWKSSVSLPSVEMAKVIYDRVNLMKSKDEANERFNKLRPGLKPIIKSGADKQSDFERYKVMVDAVYNKAKDRNYVPIDSMVETKEIDQEMFQALKNLKYLISSVVPALTGFYTWDSREPDGDVVTLLMEEISDIRSKSVQTVKKTSKLQIVLDAINAHPDKTMSKEDISKKTGVNVNTASGILYKLREQNVLFKIGKKFTTVEPVQDEEIAVHPIKQNQKVKVSESQQKILDAAVRGITNGEICTLLGITAATTSYHVKRLMEMNKLFKHGKIYTTEKNAPVEAVTPAVHKSIHKVSVSNPTDNSSVLLSELITERGSLIKQRIDLDEQIRSFDNVISAMRTRNSTVITTILPQKHEYMDSREKSKKYEDILAAIIEVSNRNGNGYATNKEVMNYTFDNNLDTFDRFRDDMERTTKEVSKYLTEMTARGMLTKIGRGRFRTV